MIRSLFHSVSPVHTANANENETAFCERIPKFVEFYTISAGNKRGNFPQYDKTIVVMQIYGYFYHHKICMPEYRHDPLTGRWVIIAEERASRPNQFDAVDLQQSTQNKQFSANSEMIASATNCPFCRGNESETPGEIDAIRNSDVFSNSMNWETRVVPNKFPAIHKMPRFCEKDDFADLFGHRIEPDDSIFSYGEPLPGFGAHEVIIETSRHLMSVSQFDDHEMTNMFLMYRRRLSALRSENRWAHALIFKNVGAAAGASLPHTHSQLMAMPFVPPPIMAELRRAAAYRKKRHRCYWCDMITFEHEATPSRVVLETERYLALCPFASRFPMEVSILPKEHVSHFENLADDPLRELALLVRKTVALLEKTVYWVSGDLAYNMILKSCPFDIDKFHRTSTGYDAQDDSPSEDAYHFQLTILPSLAKAAGFEWGTGLHINPISPETAAARLRTGVQS